MERKILHISSCRESIVEDFSSMIRNLGRRSQRALWGRAFNPFEEAEDILYLDSGGRGNLEMMAKSMGADTIEILFISKETGKACILISELLIPAVINGEFYYKSSPEANKTIGKRVAFLDSAKEDVHFLAIKGAALEKSGIYPYGISEARRNVNRGHFYEGSINELYSKELPDIVICDAFTKSGVLAILEKLLGKPCVLHISNGDKDIYAPCSALSREVFIETEELIKDALCAICFWLSDNNEYRSGMMLYESFFRLKGGEGLIRRTEEGFMKVKSKKERTKDEH